MAISTIRAPSEVGTRFLLVLGRDRECSKVTAYVLSAIGCVGGLLAFHTFTSAESSHPLNHCIATAIVGSAVVALCFFVCVASRAISNQFLHQTREQENLLL